MDMNAELEQLIAQGEALVEEKERNKAIHKLAQEEEAKQARAEVRSKFMDGLQTLIPAAVIAELEPVGDDEIWGGWPELKISIDGCPIVFQVCHTKGEFLKINGSNPFMVAGIYASDPYIYEGELFPGGASYSFTQGTRSSNFTSIVEALGTARKLALRLAENQTENEAKYQQLQEQMIEERVLKAAKLPEPVYVAEDGQIPNQTGTILNMDELYHYVRGVASEVFEEQRAF
jgi:hypothetical protein